MANDTSNDDKLNTPKQWTGPKDARDMEGAGEYPNYWTHKTRSGHVFMLDDSKGSEHVTMQHRSGSMVQFMPDGAVQFVSHNGQYTFTFGENRVKITGAYDVTVEGAASMKVNKDYNLTVHGDMKYFVDGKFKLSAKRFEQLIEEDIDIEAKNRTEKISQNISQTAKGSQYIGTVNGGITVAAPADTVAIGAAKVVGLAAGDQVMLRAANKISVKSTQDGLQVETMKDIGLQTKQGAIAMKAVGGDIAMQTDEELAIKSEGNMSVQSESEMSIHGQMVGINADEVAGLIGGSSVTVKAKGGRAYVGGSKTVELKGQPVNLNGADAPDVAANDIDPQEPGKASDAKQETIVST